MFEVLTAFLGGGLLTTARVPNAFGAKEQLKMRRHNMS